MENVKKKVKKVQLLTFDEKSQIYYSGFCKLKLNALSKYLLVDPFLEDINPVSTAFDSTVIRHKHILLFNSQKTDQHFALIFKNVPLCKKIFCVINKYKDPMIKTTIPEEEELFKENLILSLFRKLNDSNISTIISTLIKRYNESEKRNLIKILKENDLLEDAFTAYGNQLNVIKKEEILLHENECCKNTRNKINRKRKIAAINKSNNDTMVKRFNDKRNLQKKIDESKFTKVIQSEQFNILHLSSSKYFRRLLIYTLSDLNKFHEYKCRGQNNVFTCIKCHQKNSAIIELDKNGEICVKLTEKKHLCKPKEIISLENYSKITILKKQKYEVTEIYSFQKILFVFDSDDRNECYDFFWCAKRQKFICCGCNNIKSATWIQKCKALIFNEKTENEYVELYNDSHICEKRKYEPQKFQQQFKEIVLRPNFEIHNINGKETKKLIIFDVTNRNLCYFYNYSPFQDCFYCVECTKNGKNITAKSQKNNEGEEYILLSNVKHVCKLQKYNPPIYDIIYYPPEIEYMGETKNGIPKLFVFDKNDKKKCYIFTAYKKTDINSLYCLGCATIIGRNYTKISGHFYKDEEKQSYSFRIKGNFKHVCEPKIYNPQKYQSFKTYDFFYYRAKDEPSTLKLAIYHSDKNFCYSFRFSKSSNSFICRKCESKNKFINLAVRKDGSGKEYFEHDSKKHFCEPIKISSITGPEFIKLDFNDLIKESPAAVKKSIPIIVEDESKIIRKPNFELHPNQKGAIDKKLVIYHSEDKSLVYEYSRERNNSFKCSKCSHKNLRVLAKLHKNENEEEFIVLSKNNHICQPSKYKPPLKIVESPNFKVFNFGNDETKCSKLIVFIPESQKDECYEYTFAKNRKSFQCFRCRTKTVTAKLMKKENNEEFILLLGNQHICTPIKFKPEKYEQQRIIQIFEPLFDVFQSNDNETEQRLIIFTSEKKEMYFNYRWNSKTSFLCKACSNRKKQIYAKLKENENGQKYVEIINGLFEHNCKPQKYEKRGNEGAQI